MTLQGPPKKLSPLVWGGHEAAPEVLATGPSSGLRFQRALPANKLERGPCPGCCSDPREGGIRSPRPLDATWLLGSGPARPKSLWPIAPNSPPPHRPPRTRKCTRTQMHVPPPHRHVHTHPHTCAHAHSLFSVKNDEVLLDRVKAVLEVVILLLVGRSSGHQLLYVPSGGIPSVPPAPVCFSSCGLHLWLSAEA